MMLLETLAARAAGSRRVHEAGTVSPREFFAKCPSLVVPTIEALKEVELVCLRCTNE